MTATAPIQPGVPLDDEALLALARFLHDGADPHDRTLWFVMLDAERCALPAIVPVDGIPAGPDPETLTSLAWAWRQLRTEVGGAALVVMLERPGPEQVTAADRAWHAALHTSAAEHGLAVAGFFVASDDGVRPLTRDDVD